MSDQQWYPPILGLDPRVLQWVRDAYSFRDSNDQPENVELDYFYRFAPQANNHYYGDVLRRSQSFAFRYVAIGERNYPHCDVCGSPNMLSYFRSYFCNRVCADHYGSPCFTFVYDNSSYYSTRYEVACNLCVHDLHHVGHEGVYAYNLGRRVQFNRLYYGGPGQFRFAFRSVLRWRHRIQPYLVARLDARPFYLANRNPQEDEDDGSDASSSGGSAMSTMFE